MSAAESAIRDHAVVIYELLSEMLDNGYPITTEPNVLKEIIKPPSTLKTVVNAVTGGSNMSSELPSGQLSNVPWRRSVLPSWVLDFVATHALLLQSGCQVCQQ
jgi:AP-3 complex subunit mu